MPDDSQKSQSGRSMSKREDEELDSEGDILEGDDLTDEEMDEEDRGAVSDESGRPLEPEQEAEIGGRVTRDDGDNDDLGELK